MTEELNYRQELYRKLIHISSMWVPLSVFYLEDSLAFLLLSTAFISIVLFEILRRKTKTLNVFSEILRPCENEKKLTGAFYMLLGALITFIIFPKIVCVTALSVLMISDSFAALIGKRWGKHPLASKTLEGTLAFFVSALIITVLIGISSNQPFAANFFISSIIASVTATICELYSPKLNIDDNLLIPVVFAFTQALFLQII